MEKQKERQMEIDDNGDDSISSANGAKKSVNLFI